MTHATSPERGASALLVAASLLVLAGFAAVAVDLSGAFTERRQDQTAADLGVLAGALDFDDDTQVVSETLDYVRRNLSTTYADGDWQTIWEACSDANRPPDFLPLPEPAAWGGGTLDCLSRSTGRLRVRVPDQLMDTTFGRTMGVTEIATNAYAVASVEPVEKGLGILPFAVRGGQGAGKICLKTSSSGTYVAPCGPNEAGSFGTLLSPNFGNQFFPTAPNCNPNQVMAQNIAVGVDHLIITYGGSSFGSYPQPTPPSNSDVINSDASVDDCAIVNTSDGPVAVPTDGAPIDTVAIDTGNVQSPINSGLISNDTFLGERSRLQQWPSGQATQRIRSQHATWELDDRPLWDYLTNSAGTLVASCDKSTIAALPDNLQRADAMAACLSDYEAAGETTPIFADTIEDSPRWAWSPQIWHEDLGSGTSYSPVHNFRMVFIDGLFFNCNSGGCDLVFFPDNGDPGDGNDPASATCVTPPGSCKSLGIDQITGYALPLDSVSIDVRKKFPYGTGTLILEPILFE